MEIKDVKPTKGYLVLLTFTDDSQREMDLEPYLHGPIFEPIKSNLEMFRSVKVDDEQGTIVWDNGADIDPDVLYENLTPAWQEDEQTIHEQK